MLLVFSFIFGLAVGSFLNAWIWRLKHGQSVLKGRSRCPECGKTLKWVELIPLISFIRQKGRCLHCHKKISWQYPLVELVLGLLFLMATFLRLGTDLPIDSRDLLIWLRDLFLMTFLLGIFVFDLRYYLIPDQFTLPALVIVFIVNRFLGIPGDKLLLGVIVGFAFFAAQYAVSKGKWVGGGDIRLGALMGAILSWPLILVALFLAYFIGSIAALVLIVRGRKTLKSQLPFGTFLAASTIFTLYWGQSVLDWYLRMLGF